MTIIFLCAVDVAVIVSSVCDPIQKTSQDGLPLMMRNVVIIDKNKYKVIYYSHINLHDIVSHL